MLTAEQIAREVGRPAESVTQAAVVDRGVASVGSLLELKALRKLDLSGNRLSDLSCVRGLGQLTHIKAQRNRLSSIEGVAGLPSLAVLDVSDCGLQSLAGVADCPALFAVIAPRNPIADQASLDALAKLPALTTLVLRDAKLGGLSLAPLMRLSGLRRLSLNSCGLKTLPWSNRPHRLVNLRELRLYGNEIARLDPFLVGCQELHVLDLGGNKLAELEPALQQAAKLRSLTHLTLRGNPAAAGADYQKAVIAAFGERLKCLDDRPPGEERKAGEAAPQPADGAAEAAGAGDEGVEQPAESARAQRAREKAERRARKEERRGKKIPRRLNVVQVSDSLRPDSEDSADEEPGAVFEAPQLRTGAHTAERHSGVVRVREAGQQRGGKRRKGATGDDEEDAPPAARPTGEDALEFLLGGKKRK
eukprot:TRINITY_DN13974_c0_g1_i1.p1 TRINITY_DN13974_c0_g1~~TRINITY_DN13974_c0_g1_i1.p1  ORF type:complete len:446 (+),score=167.09 TRINITY_DN13974_c0_g1_i1:83-1339(+)